MSAIPVPTVNIAALYNNTTSGTDADPQVMDNAIIDIVATINTNASEQNNNTSATILPHADGSVITNKLADAAVTTVKIAPLAVTTAKIAAGAVGAAQLDPTLLTDYGDIAVQAEFDRRGVNVMKYGAKGDGSDDTAAIQAAADAMYAARNVLANGISSTLYFPMPISFYKITAPISILTNYISIEGASKGARIINSGTGAAFTVTATYIVFKKIGIWGNGAAYGVGASGTHGIDFNNSSQVTIDDVDIRYHGSHGINIRNGGYSFSIINCRFSQNLGDAVHAVSPSGSEQNGNALSIVNSALFNNTGNGVNWKAAGLNMVGNTIEANKGAGILVDCTGSTLSANGVSITGNYFESSRLGQIKLVNIVGYVIVGIEISGNYFYSSYAGSDGATALIVATGAFNSMYSLSIGKNSYNYAGGKVAYYVDLGNSCRHSCLVDVVDLPAQFTGLGLARCIYGLRSRTANGLFQQRGYTYSDFEKSDNIYAMTPKTGRFKLELVEGEQIRKFNIYVESNCTDNYTVTLTLQSADLTTLTGLATVYFTTVTAVGGGNKLITWDLAASYYRLAKNFTAFLKLDITNPATGSTMYLRNLTYEFA